ncbi:MAG: type VI secretion system membrane subunit TssM [Pseudomonadota bacterium]|nr:type VI secretion system membrane subunit TssM [Pseudomonadota bacterium]
MKRIISILTNKIFLGLLGVIALSLVIWFGADFVKFGEDNETLSTTVRLILMLGVLLIWLLAQLLAMWLSHRKNNSMLKEIEEDQVDQDALRAGEEVSALNQRFSEGMAILKRAKFDTGKGKVALYQLPWYIIIGPPGSGKTTALVNSGLEFPLAETHGKNALGGIGGTRNCDWWFTNEAVMIDTAGRYTTQDSHKTVDSSAWQGFLTLLKKHRPRRPINGALIAISVQDLLTQQPAQRSYNAKLIRERIDELQKSFGVKFPIYVMLTKCDLVAGFTEFFSNLTQPERQQIWGTTFNIDSNQQLNNLPSELDQLIGRLNDRVLWRVHNERDPAKRALIQAFPQQMENLKPLLVEFMSEAFAANRYSEQPLLRGVYFCSGTQEGTPIDRMMSAVSSNFGLSRDALRNQAGSGKSFFINRLFKDVVFPEEELVGSNKKLENSLLWLRRGYFAVLALVFVALIGVWSVTLSRNNDYMSQVNQYIAQYKAEQSRLGQFDQDPVNTLPILQPLYEASRVYNQEDHPWLSSVGLYDGSVDEAADALYLNALRKDFLPRFQFFLEQRLQSMNATNPDLIDTFRAYLMLVDREHFDPNVLRNWAGDQWQQRLPGEAAKQSELNDHLNVLLKQGFGNVALNDSVVEGTRFKLKQIPAAQRLYSQMKSGDLGRETLDLYSQIGGNSAAIFGYAQPSGQLQMPALYSKPGFKSLDFSVKSPLLRQLERDRWIFGSQEVDDFTEADMEKLGEELKSLYLNDYTSQWSALLGELHVARFTDLTTATATLKQMADPVFSPVVAILRVTKENTALTPGWPKPALLPGTSATAAGAAEAIIGKVVKPTAVDVAFRDINQLTTQTEQQQAPINDVLAGIKELHGYLNNMAVSPDPNEAAFQAAKARYTTNSADAIRKLRILATNTPKPVSIWLNELADHSWGVILQGTKAHLDRSWNQQVYSVYERTLGSRYPLRKVSAEATVDDFSQFLAPGGVESAFVQENVKPFLDRNWLPKALEGQSVAFSEDSLGQLRGADTLRLALYRAGDTPGYDFSLKPMGLDTAVGKFELQLGDQRFAYTHGPKLNKNASWRSGRDTNIRILFEDLNQTLHRETYTGAWAWYRLLDDAAIRKVGNTTYQATFNKNGRNAKYQLTAASRISGLNLSLLRNYRCPQGL